MSMESQGRAQEGGFTPDIQTEFNKLWPVLKTFGGTKAGKIDHDQINSALMEDYDDYEVEGSPDETVYDVSPENIVSVLESKGITSENNEIVAALAEFGSARATLREAQQDPAPSAELRERKRGMRVAVGDAQRKLAEAIHKYEPFVTGAF